MSWFLNLLRAVLPERAGLAQNTVASQRKRRSSRPRQFESLEQRLVPAAFHLDFGSKTSEVSDAYVAAPVAAYSSKVGYGWTNASGVREVVRSEGTDLTSDFHAEKDRTFQLDVPNGKYLVTPTLGDATMVRDRIDLYLNGTKVGSNLTIQANDPYRPTYLVNVTDGKLTLRLVDNGGVTVRWALSALDVASTTSTAPVVSVNPNLTANEGATVKFQGLATGSGLTYAWDFGDGSKTTGTLAPSHVYKDNGEYDVTLTATDSQGRSTKASLVVTVKNVAPKVTLTGAPAESVREGTAVTLGSTMTDASSVDVAAGFKATWTVTKNGKAYASASGSMPKFTFTPDDEGTYVVSLKITDKNGATSSTDSATIVADDAPLRPNILGPYLGTKGQNVTFVGIARDHGLLDTAAGFTYSWKFGDGGTATGATATHKYAAAGKYTVTLTVTGDNGEKVSTTTTATIDTSAPKDNDYETLLNSALLSNVVYGNVQADEMASSGAWGVNAKWEQGSSSKWYIEQQRHGESLIIDGILHKDTAAIAAGLKAFDWGFKQQKSDGSFGTTEDPFHSTSLFMASVARASLLLRQSPYASQYAAKVDGYEAKLAKAANWMTQDEVWSRGISNNEPYTHRRFLVAAALGLTSKLNGNGNWMTPARSQIIEGLALQETNGVNPEMGGYDSSYQTVGVMYAQLWTTYLPDEPLTPKVNTMIDKALAWEQSRILSTGEVNTDGNTRCGVEDGPSGTLKTVDWRKVVGAFAQRYEATGNKTWLTCAQKVAQCYFKTY